MAKNGAIVTGAASGVGLELTRHLVAKGWYVVMADINPAGEAISKEFKDRALWIKTDTANWDSQSNMFDQGMILKTTFSELKF